MYLKTSRTFLISKRQVECCFVVEVLRFCLLTHPSLTQAALKDAASTATAAMKAIHAAPAAAAAPPPSPCHHPCSASVRPSARPLASRPALWSATTTDEHMSEMAAFVQQGRQIRT